MGRLLDRLETKMPRLHRFLTRHDKPWPLVRELTFGIGGLLLIVVLLFGLTGQPVVGGYPVVVVTSGSMMHCTNGHPPLGVNCHPDSYGRLGTIDPGDLVFVRKTHDPGSVSTKAGHGGSHYGGSGDVVVYKPHMGTFDLHATPIIHRALFYLQVNADGTFTVSELGLNHVSDLEVPTVTALTGGGCNLNQPRVGAHGQVPWTPAMSGFITRGDNNPSADQCLNAFRYDPVTQEMTLGKARGEVPWVGLVNLLVGDLTGKGSNFANAGSDSKVMLLVVVIVVVATPYTVRAVRRYRAKKEEP